MVPGKFCFNGTEGKDSRLVLKEPQVPGRAPSMGHPHPRLLHPSAAHITEFIPRGRDNSGSPVGVPLPGVSLTLGNPSRIWQPHASFDEPFDGIQLTYCF